MVQATELALIGDTIAATPEPTWGVVLTPPSPPPEAPLRTGNGYGVSFITAALFILFLIVALRFRDNIRYIGIMFRNIVETRTRQNVFDDTVRETSLIFLLNFMWVVCAGITGFCVFQALWPEMVPWSLRAEGMLCGMGVAAIYALFMWGAYGAVGRIFSDATRSRLWVKGYSAAQALMAPAFFIIALTAICRPEAAPGVGCVAVSVFLLAKLAFIWKGYRIFFNQFSSWVLFLCYLCSLEIVPLILCYRLSLLIGRML